jgi:hypothetical protein
MAALRAAGGRGGGCSELTSTPWTRNERQSTIKKMILLIWQTESAKQISQIDNGRLCFDKSQDLTTGGCSSGFNRRDLTTEPE